MPVELFSNLAQTAVSSGGTTAPSAGTTETWTVASSAAFPAASAGASPPTQFHVADTAPGKSSEIIAVTSVSGTTWTVTRGAEGTTPVAHAVGFTVMIDLTAAGLSGMLQAANNLSDVATRQTALNNLAGAVTSGQFPRGNGTNVVMSAIQAADIPPNPVTAIPAATGTVNLDPLARVLSATMTGNCTFTFSPSSGLAAGDAYVFSVYLAQDATGGRTATWPGSVSWLGGAAPTLPAAANTVSLLIFETINQGTTWYGSAVQELPALPLAIANGGTGAATRQGALNALAGTQSAGNYLRSDGTNMSLTGIVAGDVPTLNQNTTGTAANLAGGATLPAYLAPKAVTLTDAATVAVDASLGNYFRLLLTSAVGASRTIAAPTSAVDGDSFTIAFQQPASGGPCAPSFTTGAGGYSFGTDSTPTWSTTASVVDEIGFRYHGGLGKWLCQGWKLGFS